MPEVENLETDFADGTRLCALVEALQKRRLRYNKRPLNQHHELENIAIALDAIKEDGIKLVNIGRNLLQPIFPYVYGVILTYIETLEDVK